MSSVCFLDNDIFLKLVACDLFDEALEILNIKESDLRVLPSARYYFRKKKRYPEALRIKVTETAQHYQTIIISSSEAINEVEKLQKYESIDDGEAILVAATREEESFWLITGDKRFLRTLANSPELDLISSRLQGKVICLEQLIRKLIFKQGFNKTLTNVLPARQYDTALKSIFGSGKQCTKDNVLKSLEAYIEDLRKDTKEIMRDI